jgi:hypothetical protein
MAGSLYQPSQIWSYHTRPGEEDSRLTILQIDAFGTERIVHIRVDGFSFPGPKGKPIHTIPHMPVFEEAIDRSVVSLLETGAPLPEYQEGYNLWREAFDQGAAGAFRITVAEAIEAIAGVFQGKRVEQGTAPPATSKTPK